MTPPGLWVTEQGPADNPVVVLVHGSMDRSASFAKVAKHLDGQRVVRYDRRGYGRSIRLGSGTIAEHAEDLVAVIGDRRAAVVGHSLGGLVALAAASARRQVLAVGSWEAPLTWADWWPERSAGAQALATGADPEVVAETFVRRLSGDAHWERLPRSTQEERRREGEALVADLESARAGPPFDPATITCPVLVGYGSQTAERHRRAVIELAALLGSPEPFVAEGATHGAHRSHPAQFAAFVHQVAQAA